MVPEYLCPAQSSQYEQFWFARQLIAHDVSYYILTIALLRTALIPILYLGK